MLNFSFGVHRELLYAIPTNWLISYLFNALKLKGLKTLFHEKFVCLGAPEKNALVTWIKSIKL